MIIRIMRKIGIMVICFLSVLCASSQLKWKNVDSLYQPLPSSVHVYFTDQPIDTGAFRAYYLIADLKDKNVLFDVDTTLNRRLTPTQFYQKNKQPLVVVNCTFFSFQTNQNLNIVIKKGKPVATNEMSIALRGKDTLKYFHTLSSLIGISKKRNLDVAWVYTDDDKSMWASPWPVYWIDSSQKVSKDSIHNYTTIITGHYGGEENMLKKWKAHTAVGGGPVIIQDRQIKITNNEERKFAGKAINDKHPRTAMGYTADRKLIILVVQGRSESSGGATLVQEAQILKDLGCWEALNLDGGGSSCMLINGKETIKPSDKEGQRPVPAVFLLTRSEATK